MKRLYKYLFIIAISFSYKNLRAEDKFVVIADASIPALNDSAHDICRFSDKVSSGSSMIVTGGVIALTFSVKEVSLTSDLRILLYADSTTENPTPQIAFIAKPIRNIPDKVKFNKHKFPCKAIGDRLFIAETVELLNAVQKIPPKDKSSSDVTVKLFPEKYFNDCSGTVEAFKAKIEKEFSKGRKDKNVELKGEIKEIENLLKQCRKLDLVLNSTADNMTLDLIILPEKKSEIEKLLKSHNGTLNQKDLLEMTEKAAGSQNIKITDEIKSALSFILSRIFTESDTDAIAEKLCQFKISSEDNKLIIGLSITPQQAKDILTSTGVLNKMEDKGKRKTIKF